MGSDGLQISHVIDVADEAASVVTAGGEQSEKAEADLAMTAGDEYVPLLVTVTVPMVVVVPFGAVRVKVIVPVPAVPNIPATVAVSEVWAVPQYPPAVRLAVTGSRW